MFLIKTGLGFLLLLLISCSAAIDQNSSGTDAVTANDIVSESNPGAVKDFKVAASQQSNGKWNLTLTWSETANTTTYDVKSGISSKIYPDIYSNVKSPFVLSNLEAGSTHYFVVLSSGTVNNTVVTVTSSEFTFTIPIDSYIEKPGPFTMNAVPGDGQVVVSWAPAERATYYVIQKGTSTGVYTKVVKSAAQSPYTDKEVINGTTLYYIVIAVNSKGSTNATEEVGLTPSAGPISFGTLTATVADSSVNLSWGNLSGALSYQIKRGSSQSGPFSVVGTSSSNSFIDTGLTNGSVYYYIVSALGADDVSLSDSSVVSANPMALPGAFTVTPTIASHQIQLAWTTSTGASSYTVEYGTSSGSYPTIVSSNATSPTTISSLTNGTTYYFKVIATNPAGNTSSSELALIPTISPGVFTVSSAVGNQQIELTWTASSNAASYTIDYGTSSGVYTSSISNAVSPATVTSLTNGTTYYFKVTAINGAGTRASSQLSAIPGPPGSFSITSSQSSSGQVTLHWSAASGAVNYTVDYGTSSGVYSFSSAQLPSLQTTITGLSNGTTYFFRVVAHNGGGDTNTAENSSTPTAASWTPGIHYSFPGYEWIWSNAVDSQGNVYLTGYSNFALSGQTQHAYADYIIEKYDSSGSLLWVRQDGPPNISGYETAIAKSVTTDSSGNIYITGQTTGPLGDQSKHGDSDYFIIKYDGSGNRLWTRQMGGASGSYVNLGGIVLDSSGNIYASGDIGFGSLPGQTAVGYNDYFLVKYDTNGNLIWTQQYGSGSQTTIGRQLAVDSSDNIYVTGTAHAAFSGQTLTGTSDFFVAKYDSAGNRLWLSQYGAPGGSILYDTGVAVSGTNVFVSGTTSAAFAGHSQSGTRAAFIGEFDSSGNLVLIDQYDSGTADMECTGITSDSLGAVYLSGFTSGSLDGQSLIGSNDFFLMKFDSSGSKVYTRQNGSSGGNYYTRAVTKDAFDNIFISGTGSDFTVKYNSLGVMQ